uniref:Uncharacterized protein n=1 Tax=Anguilla anguilla TaxID=7936 RepID=A0A0E9TGS2_ANGAN
MSYKHTVFRHYPQASW